MEPPYFSTLSRSTPTPENWGSSLSLKLGLSVWAAAIISRATGPSGSRKAITDEPLRIT